MKKRSLIWIDHIKAHILENGEDGITMTSTESEDVGKATKEHSKKFYHTLATKLQNYDRILVVGPGMAKEEFRNHCEDHHQHVSKAIVEVKNMKDHPTFEELKKESKLFFDHDFAWTGP